MGDYAFERGSVIAPESSTNWYEGTGILESVMGTVDGYSNGDYLGMGGNMAAGALSLVGAIMDPFQAVFAAGVGWLMENLSVLREPLDWLCGDPKEIEGHAATWRNIGERVNFAATSYADEVRTSTLDWTTLAADAYRGRAGRHIEDIQALSGIGEGIAKMTLIAGAMVGVIRNTVRDIIAEVVGAAISKAVQALLVVTIPKVLAEVALLVAECSAKILNLLKRLVGAVSRLTGDIQALSGLLDRIGTSLKSGTDGALVNGGWRAQAAGDMMERGPVTGIRDGWTATKEAYRTIGKGHTAVHGTTDAVVGNTLRSASVNNSLQNSGATGDKLPDASSDTPIDLPL
ncbi:hypothetical protein [Couchioplanes caeruleus]|uniref:WXG100 family type VII secretion target n=2 Tax=Couchioplanes caeruleus TaxID=56438 RepID=A0A1K0FPT6_9ACTN|nr:hypothetical protein [Couchioplanes caeruleus]OJF14853.1 hypothetical protein BG844_07470 [Couchioplanes caeruleus subsp. caeruleus]ROP32149.1 hypothetical protein EDD30_5080 [Couchioplanes caeruleus]